MTEQVNIIDDLTRIIDYLNDGTEQGFAHSNRLSQIKHGLKQFLIDTESDRERLAQMLEGNFVNAFIQGLNPTDRGFEMMLRTPFGGALAEFLINCIQMQKGAENYVECEAHHPEAGPLTIRVERKRGKTPAKFVSEYRSALQDIKAIVDSVSIPEDETSK